MILAASRRITGAVIVIVAVSATVFFAGRALAPGNVATIIIGAEGATAQQRHQLEHRLGLDRSPVEQYGDWLGGVVHGDFGISPISQRSATSVLGQEAPVSVELALLALLLATVVGVPLGVVAAIRANGPTDFALRGAALSGFSVPVFVSGTLFVLGAARWAPSLYSAKYVSLTEDPIANLRGMVLPVITAAIPVTALLMQMTRGTMLEQLSQPFVRVAETRGVPGWRIHFIHALKNALSPIVTFQGFQFGILLGSLFVVEQVFSLPGLGRGVIQDIGNRDFVLVEAQVMVIAAAFVLGNLLVDLVDPIIDRRKAAAA